MIKPIQKTAISLMALALAAGTLSSASPANAAGVTPSLTYAEFTASQGYKDLMALNDLNLTALAALTGIHQEVNVSTTVTANTTIAVNMKIDATKTNATAHFSQTTVENGDHYAYDYYFANGNYVTSVDGFQLSDDFVNNMSEALARLNKPNATAISIGSATPPTGFIDINPSELFASKGQDPLAGITASKYGVLYTPIDCVVPADLADTHVCTFSAGATSMGVTVNIDVALRFDATGLLTSMTMSESTNPAGFVLTMSTVQSANNGWVQTLPDAASTVTKAQLLAASYKINAEIISTANAKDLVAKAKVMAKKAKAKITVKTLTDSAKALRQKVSKIKNGVKQTTTWHGQSSSVCTTVVNGKTASKRC